MLPKKIVTRVMSTRKWKKNVWKRTKVTIKKMKRNEGCEKVHDTERRGEKWKGEEARVCSGTGKDEKRLSKFHGASSGRGTHYIFLSISGRDWPFRFVS